MADVKVFSEMTIAEKFGAVAAMLDAEANADMVEFLNDRASKATRKSGERKPSKVQIEMQDVICPLVLDALAEVGKPVTVGDLIKIPTLAEFVTESGNALTSSKVTAALTKLKDAKQVVKTDEKGKSLYAVA